MSDKNLPTLAIIGGGAAALMLAAQIDTSQYKVTIYEKNKALGRKFLVAGNGGFNLTHGSEIEQMIYEYQPVSFLQQSLVDFDNQKLREWLKTLGVDTYVGSSQRVFPEKGMKPIDVLNAIDKHLQENGVNIKFEYSWVGFTKEGDLSFSHEEEVTLEKVDHVVFALGGASWAKTGSSGEWLSYFEQKGIPTLPFQASNCGFKVDWDPALLKKIEGTPIKNIALFCSDQKRKGELMVTKFGLEGSPLYAHSGRLRKQLSEGKNATVFIDFKPTLTKEVIVEKIEAYKTRKSWTVRLQKSLNLSNNQLAIIRELTTKDVFMKAELIAKSIKKFPISITGIAPIEEAISTVGGIALDAVDESFQLKSMPNHYVIGEMLDWDAPTGGYLLQGCFSMGAKVAEVLNKKS